jgi:glycyl-tRNA synthetase
VGHADRACYDLEVHSKATKTPMLAVQKLDQPRDVTIAKLKFDRKVLGHVFMQDQRVVAAALEALAEDWDDFETHVVRPLEDGAGEAIVDGRFRITKDMVSWTKAAKKIHEVKFTPSVIEPSFGMGRILYALLEHSFYQRDGDEQRIVMRFNPRVAPNKVAVLPISSGTELNEIVSFFLFLRTLLHVLFYCDRFFLITVNSLRLYSLYFVIAKCCVIYGLFFSFNKYRWTSLRQI